MQTWLAGLVERVELVELVELFELVGVLLLLALGHNRNLIRLKWLEEQQSIPLLLARILSLKTQTNDYVHLIKLNSSFNNVNQLVNTNDKVGQFCYVIKSESVSVYGYDPKYI